MLQATFPLYWGLGSSRSGRIFRLSPENLHLPFDFESEMCDMFIKAGLPCAPVFNECERGKEGKFVSEQGLQKTLKQRHINMIAIGGVIGAGLFVGSGSVISSTGPGAIVCYILAGLLVVIMMRMLGEMAVANPSSGSFAVYASEAIGPWAGYTIGWLYWYMWVIVIAFEATAGAATLNQILPSVPIWLLSVILTALLTIVNIISVKNYGEFEYWFAMIKVVAIVCFLVIGVAFILGILPGVQSPGFYNLYGSGGFMPKGWASVGAGLLVVVFSYFGTEVATIAAAETADPAKNVRMAINTVVWRILLFYIGSIAVIIFILPWNESNILKSPFVTVMQLAGIPIAAKIMTFVVLTAVLSCLSSGLYTSSRIIYGMAEKGEAPKVFLKLNRAGVPIVALLTSTVGSFIAAAFNYISPTVVFTFLLNASGAVALYVYLAIAVSHFIKRRQAERTKQEIVAKMWFFPYLNYVAILGIWAILLGMLINPDLRSQIFMTTIVGIVFLISYFLIFKKEPNKQDENSNKIVG